MSQDFYRGSGWGFVNFRNMPERIAAPLMAIGMLASLVLFGLGIFLIWSLIGRVWHAGTDIVPAASAALTAIAAIFGAVFLTWRTVVAHWQARANQEQTAISRESHYTTLFTKAVEQLGAVREIKEVAEIKDGESLRYETRSVTEPNLEVRIGAVYALERIAQDSLRDHWAIMEVLCAYVRENSKQKNTTDFEASPIIMFSNFDAEQLIKIASKEFEEWKAKLARPRADIQAAITVIGRRSSERRNWEAENAKGRADRFYLDLRGANLRGIDFRGLWFERARFDGCQLEFTEFWSSHFADAEFANSNFSGSSIWESDFKGAHFTRVKAVAAVIIRNDMVGCQFAFSEFVGTTWNYTDLDKCRFVANRLKGCLFYRIEANYTEFLGGSNEQSDFSQACLDNARFDGSVKHASFENASLYGADFTKAEDLSAGQLKDAFEGDEKTRLPSGINRPPHWPNRAIDPVEARRRMTENINRLIKESNDSRNANPEDT